MDVIAKMRSGSSSGPIQEAAVIMYELLHFGPIYVKGTALLIEGGSNKFTRRTLGTEDKDINGVACVPLMLYNYSSLRSKKELGRCVDSVLLPDVGRDIEVILVDDGSPDDCPRICDDYALADSRVKAVHKQNGGLSMRATSVWPRRLGIIMFVDSDDSIGALDACVSCCWQPIPR